MRALPPGGYNDAHGELKRMQMTLARCNTAPDSLNFSVRIALTCAVIAVGLGGCIGDKIIYPVACDGPPNTFRFSERRWRGNVTEVCVFTEMGEQVWRVQAIQNVPVRGSRVTVGVVPSGFEQTVPQPPAEFVPIPGSDYRITIVADFVPPLGIIGPPAYPIGAEWTAEVN